MNRRFLPLAIIPVALFVAACSSNSSSSSTTSTTHASTTTSTHASTTTTTSAPSGTTQCSSSNLAISVSQGSGAAGHIVAPLVLKNTSSTSCVTGGFPGVAGTNAAGAQIIQAARQGPSGHTITLAPGAAASSLVSGVDVPSGTATSCPNLAGLDVTPPNTTVTVHIATTLPSCPGLSVTALVPGTSGQ